MIRGDKIAKLRRGGGNPGRNSGATREKNKKGNSLGR